MKGQKKGCPLLTLDILFRDWSLLQLQSTKHIYMIQVLLQSVNTNSAVKAPARFHNPEEFISAYKACQKNVSSWVCPACKHEHCLSQHSEYPRNFIYFDGQTIFGISMDYNVLKCSCCGTYHAIIPAEVCPFLSYSYSFMAEVYDAFCSTGKYRGIYADLSRRFSISSSSVQNIIEHCQTHGVDLSPVPLCLQTESLLCVCPLDEDYVTNCSGNESSCRESVSAPSVPDSDPVSEFFSIPVLFAFYAFLYAFVFQTPLIRVFNQHPDSSENIGPADTAEKRAEEGFFYSFSMP